jgi:hypothetical protein
MAKESKEDAKEAPVTAAYVLDERALSVFKHLGYEVPSETLARVYVAFKKKKDAIQPGHLTPEAYAFVAFMADLIDGKFTAKE